MNKKIMFFWALIVVCLCSTLVLYGYNQQDKNYIKLQSNIKDATIKYLDSKNIVTNINESTIVFMSDLESLFEIDSKKINDYCIESVVYSNKLLKDEFTFNINCNEENKE